MTSTIVPQMAWTNEKIPLKCIDNIGIRQIWKMLALDSGTTTKNKIALDSDNLAEFLSNRDLLPPSKMSLLKFLAINALELSAPATPVLLQQGGVTSSIKNNNSKSSSENGKKINNWVQLSGHPQSIVPTAAGIVCKKITGPNDSEVLAYQAIEADPYAIQLVPKFLGIQQQNNPNLNGKNDINENANCYIKLEDLLSSFKDPNVIDIKMGCRTFSESEVKNKTLRADLYKKMISVDSTAPTEEEHQQKAITKLRYMLFREEMSSSQSKGFRIEALRLKSSSPITDLKTIRNDQEIEATIGLFLNNRRSAAVELIERLKQMRALMEKSEFFRTHEIIGSSIFIIYDDHKVGVWLIDFAKSRRLPSGINVDHRREWIPGNCEEGLLKGMDELIKVFESVHEKQQQ